MSESNLKFSKKPLISVIIPAYNVENTIETCIKSLLNQVFEDFELVVVNDCSTDNTAEIIKKIKKNDNRLVFLELTENSGLGPVRNFGVSIAKGDYIAFVDGDDSVEPDYLLTLYNLINEHDADISQIGIRYIWKDRNYSHEIVPGVIEGELCRYRIDAFDGRVSLTPQAWNKLYKKSLFSDDGVVEYKNIVYEDAEILPGILKKVKKIVVSDEPLYNYYKVNSLITSNSAIVRGLDNYLNSLIKTLLPYIEDDYLEGLEKFRCNFPKTYLANTGNLLRSLSSYYRSAPINEKKEVVDRIIAYLIEFREKFLKIPANPLTWFDLYSNFSKQIGVQRYFINNYKKSLNLKKATELENFRERKKRKAQKVAAVIFEKTITFLDKVIPKNKSIYLFTTWSKYPHTIDNLRPIFDSIKDDQTKKKVIILNGEEYDKNLCDGNNTKILFLFSIEALIQILRSGHIFTGYSLHAIFGYRKLKKHKDRKVVQLWHGVPVKKIGFACADEDYWEEEVKKYSFIPCSSETDKKAMAKAFFPRNPDKIKVTGLPRHDLLCLDEEKLPKDYQQHLKLLRRRLNKKRLVLLAPTWRSDCQIPLEFSREQIGVLKKCLDKHDCVMGIRAHYNDRSNQRAFISYYVSDSFFSVEDIPDVNIILRETSLLITDYSSLYLDFMKMNRPVVLFTPDLKSYERGFFYDYHEFIPHDICDDFDKFMDLLEQFLGSDFSVDEKYIEIKKRFHFFGNDSGFAKRVLDLL